MSSRPTPETLRALADALLAELEAQVSTAPSDLDRDRLRRVFTAHDLSPEQFGLDLDAPVGELAARLELVWDDIDLAAHALQNLGRQNEPIDPTEFVDAKPAPEPGCE